jgi:tight adherence protein B
MLHRRFLVDSVLMGVNAMPTPALVACSAAITLGTLLLSVLQRLFGPRRNLSGRITAYMATAEQGAGSTVRRMAGWRGVWQSLGRLAPKGLSQHYDHVLQQASLPIKGEEMAAAIGVSALVVGAIFGLRMGLLGLPLGGIVGGKLPGLLLKSHLRSRLRQADQQLVDFLQLSANAMRAGHSFLQALELAAREMPNPTGQELNRTLREISLGLTVEEALLRLVDRVPSADLDLMITAVLIQRQVGGDLASILDNIASTIRERQRIKAEVKAITAQGRLSGLVISVLPIGLAFFLATMNPDYISLLWTHPIGLAMLGAGVVSLLLGIYFINKVVKIDI